MNGNASTIARTFYFVLRRLASSRRFMKSSATVTHVAAFCHDLTTVAHCCLVLFMSHPASKDTKLSSSSNLAHFRVN